jgi:hypothetical protein
MHTIKVLEAQFNICARIKLAGMLLVPAATFIRKLLREQLVA